MSVDPAIMLRTKGSARVARSAAGDAVPDHLVKALFTHVARIDAAFFEIRSPSFALCAIAEALSYPIVEPSCGHSPI